MSKRNSCTWNAKVLCLNVFCVEGERGRERRQQRGSERLGHVSDGCEMQRTEEIGRKNGLSIWGLGELKKNGLCHKFHNKTLENW